MLSSYSLVSNTRGSNRHYKLSGDDAAIKNVDRAFVDHHQRAPIARPDLTNSSVRERRSIVTEPAEMDRAPLTLWSALLGYVMEGFVLYGASVHPNACFPIERFMERFPVDHYISQSGGLSPLIGCGAVVPYSADPLERVAQSEHGKNRNTSGETKCSSAEAGVFEPNSFTSHGVGRWNTRWSWHLYWSLIAGFRTDWRREREIKRAVYALDSFDDRTLRDMGIRHRSQIEQTVRYCRDC
jgi:uncharacterized protein YjiS (DUF1127 family)